jgi:bifunctional non-homologous end joining protein LigD
MITHLDLARLLSAPAPFNRAGWIFELKHDGFRMLAANRKGRVELVSRRGNDFGDRFPEIATALLDLRPIVIDCELVMLNPNGRPDFERLAKRSRLKRAMAIVHAARTTPACLYAFDLLELRGKDTRSRALTARKELLRKVIADAPRILYTDHIDEQGVTLFRLANELELEGIVGKRADAPYPNGGSRSRDWVKIKTAHGRHVDEERAKWNER